MRPSSAIAGAVACASILGWAALARADQPTGTPTPYATATPAAMPTGIVGGPDGNLWFVEPGAGVDRIGSITTSGTGADYPVTLAPDSIASGVSGTSSAGALWFVESNTDIGELESIAPPATKPAPEASVGNLPNAIAADSSGNVWVTIRNEVVKVVSPYTSRDDVLDYAPSGGFPTGASPRSITAGPGVGTDQTMWFAVIGPGVDSVASVTEGGAITLYPLPDALTGTLGKIVLAPDGNLWLGLVGAAGNPSYVLRVTPTGTITPFKLPATSTADADVIAAGPDGELWMPDNADTDGGLTAVTTSGTFTSYAGILPTNDTFSSIVKDPGGADALWLTDSTASAIYRVPLQPPPTTTTPPPSTPPATITAAPPTLTATLAPISAVAKSGATLSGTISEPTGSPSTTVSYQFQYGTSTDYGSTTPLTTATATSSGLNVTAPLGGLTPYTTYHYRLVASDCSAAPCQTVSPDQTFTTGSTLQPALDTTVGVSTTAGRVLVKLRGKRHFVRLAVGELIPLGATIDARHGSVLIQSATAQTPGELASGVFSGGIFVVTQPAGATVTVLVLASSFKICLPKPSAHAAAAASKKKKKKKKKTTTSHKVVNQVFGNAHGQFSTRGHYATAADQGTSWRIADRCDGTQVAVSSGQVAVTDFVHHRTIVVTAGHHYLAHAR